MITIDRDAVITLLFACEEAMESIQNRPEPADQEEAGMRAKLLEDVEIVHSRLQVAFCGSPSICDSYHVRH